MTLMIFNQKLTQRYTDLVSAGCRDEDDDAYNEYDASTREKAQSEHEKALTLELKYLRHSIPSVSTQMHGTRLSSTSRTSGVTKSRSDAPGERR